MKVRVHLIGTENPIRGTWNNGDPLARGMARALHVPCEVLFPFVRAEFEKGDKVWQMTKPMQEVYLHWQKTGQIVSFSFDLEV